MAEAPKVGDADPEASWQPQLDNLEQSQPPTDITPLPDRALYEQLIANGVAAAARESRTIDHVTARRLAIWLANEPQPRSFGTALIHFIETSEITTQLKTHLRKHARSSTFEDRPQAGKLLEYCASRRDQLGAITERFGEICDQLDRAEVMLANAVERAKRGLGAPEPTWPDKNGPPIVAVAHHDVATDTVSIVCDATTANIGMFAIATYSAERAAHMREVQYMADRLPRDSYGHTNRQVIAAREARVIERLRAIQSAYRRAVEEQVTLLPTFYERNDMGDTDQD